MPFPDPRRLAVMLAGTTAFLDMYCTQALLPELARHFQTGPAQVGLTVSVTTLAVAMVAPLMGAMADRLGRKAVIIAGALALVLPTLAMAGTDSLGGLLILRFLQGLCVPAIYTTTVAYVGEEWPSAQVPEVIGYYAAGAGIGGVSGRCLVAVSAEYLGWREAFLLLGAVNLLSAIGIAILMPTGKNFRPAASFVDTLRSLLRHTRNPPLLATCGIGFSVLFSMTAAFTFGSFHLAEAPFSLSTAALGWIFLVYLLGIAVAPLGGRLTARFGRMFGLLTSAGCSAFGLMVTLIPALPAVIVGLTFAAVGVFIGQTVSMSVVNASAGRSRSAAVGLYVTCYYLGGSAGAVAPALVWHGFGWTGCVVMIIAVLAIALVIAKKFWHLPVPSTI